MPKKHDKPSTCSWYRIDDPIPGPSRGTSLCYLQHQVFEMAQMSPGVLPAPITRLIYVTKRVDVRVAQDGTSGDTVIIDGMPRTRFRVVDYQPLNLDTPEEEVRLVVKWLDQQGFPMF